MLLARTYQQLAGTIRERDGETTPALITILPGTHYRGSCRGCLLSLLTSCQISATRISEVVQL